jgi:hypothetical protein
MGLENSPAPSIPAAVITYLQSAMANSMGITPTNPGFWKKYSPEVPLPYGVVKLVGSESYRFASNDPSQAGFYNEIIANGFLSIAFTAVSEAQVFALARLCVRVCVDTVATFSSLDGTTLELRPVSSNDEETTDTGPGTATVFRRIVMVQYTQQFEV